MKKEKKFSPKIPVPVYEENTWNWSRIDRLRNTASTDVMINLKWQLSQYSSQLCPT
jgi:hypothetical protein